MSKSNFHYTRRDFVMTTTIAAGAALLPAAPSRAKAKYIRYRVTSPEGQKMLASYAKGVRAMLNLPADHPQNWFRNAFIHLMDCPHGNWWFYVWHRGYLGHFEHTIRALSGDDNFALPYWDWTDLPQIPDAMFDGALTPTDASFEPYTGNLGLFTSFLKPTLTDYWNNLSSAQHAQLGIRGYKVFEDLWNDVTGYKDSLQAGISGDAAYANTCGSRYLSRDNPKLDGKTAHAVSKSVVEAGLQPTNFYDPESQLSFNSSKTSSHNTQPNGATKFSILEGMPHNKVHNYVGGVGRIDPGPYGNMTNFLSPVDPIFFLHHSNMDRLWDVWTRKQKRLNLPYLPTGKDLKILSEEPFLFYVDGNGNYVRQAKAGDYLSADVFNYEYDGEGSGGEPVGVLSRPLVSKEASPPIRGKVKANVGAVEVPRDTLQGFLSDRPPGSLIAEVTFPRPEGMSTAREFDVLINAPENLVHVNADSPYYAGTVALFGPTMSNMRMAPDVTFAVPLRKTLQPFSAFSAEKSTTLNIRVVPSQGQGGSAPALKAVSLRAL